MQPCGLHFRVSFLALGNDLDNFDLFIYILLSGHSEYKLFCMRDASFPASAVVPAMAMDQYKALIFKLETLVFFIFRGSQLVFICITFLICIIFSTVLVSLYAFFYSGLMLTEEET